MSTVLVVDDRVTNRQVLSRLASAADRDAEVHAFTNPREAIVWAGEHTPDLVVTDFKMPGMDGAEFTRHFRNQPLCFDVPVIVVTIYEDKSFRYRALEAGATDFLISPVDHQEFQARVRNFLRMRRQQKIIQRRTRSLERRLASDNLVHQEALRETQEVLRQVIDAVPAIIKATDPTGRVLFANNALADLRGLPVGDVVGRNRAEIYVAADAERHAALDRRLFDGDDAPLTFEEELVDGTGERRTLLTVKTPLRGADTAAAAVVTVSLDITERKRVERLIERQNAHVRAIVDNIPNYLCATDERHRITLANMALARAHATTPDEMVGKSYADFVTADPDAAMRDCQANNQVLRSGRPLILPEHVTLNVFGERQWLETMKLPFISASGDIEVLAVASDVSERRQAAEVLREAKEAAEGANRSKSEFLAGMSHELRTPLNHIMGFSEMMAHEVLGAIGHARYKEYAENIHDSGAHLLSLLNDILDVSRFESGTAQLVERMVDPNRVIVSVERLIAEQVRDDGKTIRVDATADMPNLHADERMLRQMLLNLLSNANKFTGAGATITIGTQRLDDGAVALFVADTGVGMTADEIPTALATFGQVENIFSRDHHGAGLGLSLVKSMIEQHGGRLKIDSAPDEGTTVMLVFPPERVMERDPETPIEGVTA